MRKHRRDGSVAQRWSGRGELTAGIVMFVMLVQLFLRIDLVPPMAQPFFVPVILIVVGAYLLVEPRTH